MTHGGSTVAAFGGQTRLTIFAVGEVEYAVAGRIPRSLPAPRVLPPEVRHGEAAFPLVDLPRAFGVGGMVDAERWIFLVEEGAVRRALLADRLVGHESFDLGALQPIPAVYPEGERRRWRGLLPRPDGSLVVLLRLEGLPTLGDGAAGGEG
jgi:hypothetical protein